MGEYKIRVQVKKPTFKDKLNNIIAAFVGYSTAFFMMLFVTGPILYFGLK